MWRVGHLSYLTKNIIITITIITTIAITITTIITPLPSLDPGCESRHHSER
jgi:hypothetical protein